MADDKIRILFRSLGPGNSATINGKAYVDGETAYVSLAEYSYYVTDSGLAVAHTPEMEAKVNKLIESANNSRQQILEKYKKVKGE